MENELSNRQMINVELAARAQNKKSTKVLRRHVPREEQAALLIPFNCECSNPECTVRVQMSLKVYEKIHSSPGRFVLAKGHAEPSVEKIQAVSQEAVVVEKYALS